MEKIKIFKLKELKGMLEKSDKSIMIVVPRRNVKEVKRLLQPYIDKYISGLYFVRENGNKMMISSAQNDDEVVKHTGLEFDEIWFYDNHYMNAFCYKYLKTLIKCTVNKRKKSEKKEEKEKVDERKE